jgi:hypothetical protein
MAGSGKILSKANAVAAAACPGRVTMPTTGVHQEFDIGSDVTIAAMKAVTMTGNSGNCVVGDNITEYDYLATPNADLNMWLTLTKTAASPSLVFKRDCSNDKSECRAVMNKTWTIGIQVKWKTKRVAANWYNLTILPRDPACENMANYAINGALANPSSPHNVPLGTGTQFTSALTSTFNMG